MSPQDNLQTLENAIIAEARKEARQMLDQAKREAEQIEQQAVAETKVECARIIQHAHEQTKVLRSQAIATAQLEAQTLRLQRREHLLNSVFNIAQQRLQEEIPQRSDYVDTLHILIQQGLAHLNVDEVRLYVDEATKLLLDPPTLEKLSQTLNVHLHNGDTLTHKTGVILETLDGHRRYDNTLETRLARMKNALRTEIYHVLRGEKR